MNAKVRRKVEMGTQALEFSRAHPHASRGYAAALAQLEEHLARVSHLALQQREGILQVRAATARKRELRRTVKRAELLHVAEVAKIAAREAPGLPQKFVLTRKSRPYLSFRTAARSISAEAEAQKELLVRHGLVDTVLESLRQALEEFDQAIEQGSLGRQAHVGASAELDAVAGEVMRLVRVMDGLNRTRFAHDAELLAAWESASHVHSGSSRAGALSPPAGGTPSVAGEDRSAA